MQEKIKISNDKFRDYSEADKSINHKLLHSLDKYVLFDLNSEFYVADSLSKDIIYHSDSVDKSKKFMLLKFYEMIENNNKKNIIGKGLSRHSPRKIS